VTVSVVVVGYGPEPRLAACLQAVERQLVAGDEVILVDNGVHRLPEAGRVRVVASGRNLGFAGGCNLGVSRSNGDKVVFVNSDAILQPGAVAALRAALDDPGVGLVSGCVVLADDPAVVNSHGNPIHVTGLSWAGGHGDPVSEHQEPTNVTSVSGALFGVRRDVWDRLGGLESDFFMYYEDADLSLRCWLAGLRVRYVPQAVATHDYDFARNPRKMHLLERNRLACIMTVYPRRLLRRALPVVLVTEPLLFLLALRDGWFLQRVKAYVWLARHRRWLLSRRQGVQAQVTAPGALDTRLTTVLVQPMISPPPGLPVLDSLVSGYWAAIGAGRTGDSHRGRAARTGGAS
jgi:GT2 family glycosyltransferase